MRYLGDDDVTRMMGVGYLGEVRQGPDGGLYQYVQGVDGLGNPIGSWWRRLARKALPFARRLAPFVPGGAAALTVATPFLKQAGVAGYEGLGALYQASDGTLYQQVQGLEEDAELRGLSEDQVTQMMGIGYLGEVRQGPDGAVYQFVQGVDGLGNPIGSWWRRLARKALPFARRLAPFVPGGAAALTVATPFLKQAGVAGYEGLGALYQAPDGTVYQQVQGLEDDADLQGLEADDELQGLDDDPELRGFDEGEELRGIAEDDELRGPDEDGELRGFAEDEELRGFDEDPELQGIAGYVRQDRLSGFERYEPEQPPQTRWHMAPTEQPKVWKRAW